MIHVTPCPVRVVALSRHECRRGELPILSISVRQGDEAFALHLFKPYGRHNLFVKKQNLLIVKELMEGMVCLFLQPNKFSF